MLGKHSPTFEEVCLQYEMLRAKCLTEDQKYHFSKNKREFGCIRPVHNAARKMHHKHSAKRQ